MAHLTQKAIKNSFINLLNQHPFDKITVKDIVEDCGINRNTFYYYYRDIYDLLENVFESETSAILEDQEDFSSWQEGIIKSANFAIKNKKLIYHVYNSLNREQLEEYLYAIADHIMRQYIKDQAKDLDASEEDITLLTLFYKHAILGIMMEWVQNGMEQEPEAIIMRLGELLDGTIRESLLKAAELKSKN